MKKWFRLFAAGLMVILVCMTGIPALAADSYVTLYGFSFNISQEGKAIIRAYDDRSSEVAVPGTLLSAPVTRIDDYAFYRSALTSLDLSAATQLSSIGKSAFSECRELTVVSIPDTVNLMEFGAFQRCTALSQVTLGQSLTAIPAQCFYGCAALDSVTIPSGVLRIGDYAFAECAALSSVTLPSEVSEISDTAFDGIRELIVECSYGSYADSWAERQHYRRVYLDGFVRGDADVDGMVTILDATRVQRKLASYTETFFSEENADADGDGLLSILDATTIQRWLAGFDTPYELEEFTPYS